MKTIAKVLSMVLAGLITFSLISCGDNDKVMFGRLASNEAEEASVNASALPDDLKKSDENKVDFFSTNDMLIALQTGKISIATMPTVCIDFFMSKNEGYVMVEHDREVSFHMAVPTDKTELRDSLNAALTSLEADGTLAQLADEYLNGYIDAETKKPTGKADPTFTELPKTDGAPTLKVAITGDLAPLDYVSADGNPAGYNVALMAKIGEKAGYNIEFVSVTADARITALASGKADVIFWLRRTGDSELQSDTLLFTNSYYSCKKGIVGKFSSAEELNKAFLKGAMLQAI